MNGRCLICGRIGKLTRDHVPPKSVAPPRVLELRRLTAAFARDSNPIGQRRVVQRAPDFKTLCGTCNTDRLGHQYDPHLAKLANDFRAWVSASFSLGLSLPASFTVECSAQRVGRAIVGHILAAEERKDPAAPLSLAPMHAALREYFLDEEAALSPPYEIFVWPFPGAELMIARGFGIGTLGRDDSIFGDILKFFPLACWIVGERGREANLHFARLPLNISGLEKTAQLTISLRNVPHPSWPERSLGREYIVVVDDRTFYSVPRHWRST